MWRQAYTADLVLVGKFWCCVVCVVLVFFFKIKFHLRAFNVFGCWMKHRSLMICDVCSSTYLWMVWCWFVWLGLTLGFWFQVGSHSCCQGDSGARGKKPLLFYLRPSPFCDHPKKSQKHQHLSVITLFAQLLLKIFFKYQNWLNHL